MELLKIGAVARITSLSVATLRRLIAKGEFPQPVRITARRVAWPNTVVQEWMTTLVEAASPGLVQANG